MRRSVDATVWSLLVREPYFGHVLVGLVRVVADGECAVRIIPAGHQVRLELDPGRWSALSERERLAVLKHEVLHLTFRHPLRARHYGSFPVWGLACDLVVNQLMDTTHLPDAVTVNHFPGVALSPDDTADAYYRALLPLYATGTADAADPSGGAYATGIDGAAGGSGSAVDDDPSGWAVDSMRRWLKDEGAAASHSSWHNFAALGAGMQSALGIGIDRLVRTAVDRVRTRSWGTLPGQLAAALEQLFAVGSEVPWRRVLRMFAASSQRTYLKNTMSRPSVRYGTAPGIRVRRRTGLVVAVDTSGSVPDEDLAVFFSEIHSIWRQGATVTVLECDAAVVREYRYHGTPPNTVTGRGGTAFDPAITRANEIYPDGLVYLTDGHASRPTVPTRMPVLWVLTSGGCPLSEADQLPGRRIKLSR